VSFISNTTEFISDSLTRWRYRTTARTFHPREQDGITRLAETAYNQTLSEHARS